VRRSAGVGRRTRIGGGGDRPPGERAAHAGATAAHGRPELAGEPQKGALVVVDVDARPLAAPRGEARLHRQEPPPPLGSVVVWCFLVGHRSPALGACVAVGVITCPAARAAAPGHHPARSWVQPKPVRTAPRARTRAGDVAAPSSRPGDEETKTRLPPTTPSSSSRLCNGL
jgi:hypothetical protein